MEFWIVEEGEKRGPFQSYEVRDRIERGDLTGDELGWHKDRDDWVALREMDVFRGGFETASPTSVSEGETESKPAKPPPLPEGPPQPLLRFWARWFDVFLYITLVFAILWVSGQDILEAMGSPVFRQLWFIPFVILDGLALHVYKTTPGKFLLGLRVVREDESALGVGAALMRSLRVFIIGMGFFFWAILLPVICNAFCCWYTARKGEAPWDTISGNKVRSAGIHLYPVLLFVMLFMIILMVLALLVLPQAIENPDYYKAVPPTS